MCWKENAYKSEARVPVQPALLVADRPPRVPVCTLGSSLPLSLAPTPALLLQKNQRLSGRKPLKFLFPPPSPLQLISLSTWPHRFPHPHRKRHLICPAHGSFDLKPCLSHPHLLRRCLTLSVVSSFISFTSILLLSYTPRLVLFPHSYK